MYAIVGHTIFIHAYSTSIALVIVFYFISVHLDKHFAIRLRQLRAFVSVCVDVHSIKVSTWTHHFRSSTSFSVWFGLSLGKPDLTPLIFFCTFVFSCTQSGCQRLNPHYLFDMQIDPDLYNCFCTNFHSLVLLVWHSVFSFSISFTVTYTFTVCHSNENFMLS